MNRRIEFLQLMKDLETLRNKHGTNNFEFDTHTARQGYDVLTLKINTKWMSEKVSDRKMELLYDKHKNILNNDFDPTKTFDESRYYFSLKYKIRSFDFSLMELL